MNKFVCGADVTFKGGEKFAIDPMGVFDNVEDAVVARMALHQSFSYSIYEVEDSITLGLRRAYGFREGRRCSGYKIISEVCRAYDHPAWEDELVVN